MPEDTAESLVEHLNVYRNSEDPAVQTDALILSYADLIERVEATAEKLRASGVETGDRVLITMPNSVEHIIGVLAVNLLGAIAVPLGADAGSSRLADVADQTAPRFCLAGVNQAVLPGIQTVSLRIDPASKSAICTVEGSASAQKQMLPDQQIAFIRFTSGSTGHAKGVEITHAQQLWTARTLSEHFGLGADHRELVLVSMALSGGWQRVAATLYAGGCVIIVDKPLSVGDLLNTVVATQATGFFTPPPLVRMLLASPADRVRDALQACNTIEIGSAAVTADELRVLITLLPDTEIYFHYGLTECSRAVILDTASHPDRLATVGRPVPGVEIRIVDDLGCEVSAGRGGQILLRGPQLTSGYWQQPELNHERFVDGWLATGDYGSLDDAGFLSLRGRHDDLINCGGHCYFPDEVENALGTPAGIEQYLIAGIPDPRGVLQDIPWAFVVPVDIDGWSPKEFLALARTHLPAHMVPRQVVVLSSLPLTPSGKPDRRETVRLYATNV